MSTRLVPGDWVDPATGAPLGEATLLDRIGRARVVLAGERHDDAAIHHWQAYLGHLLYDRHGCDRAGRMAVGFEMFPTRVQPVLDAWTRGAIPSFEAFLEEVDWKAVWGFDPGLYLPLIRFCRRPGVRMLALNCPRDLVRQVGRDGWDAAAERAAAEGISRPAPASDAYRRQLAAMTGRAMADPAEDPEAARRFDRFVMAQQVWDRAFACGIARALADAEPPAVVLGIIGRGHMAFGNGTPHQLADLGIHDTAVLMTGSAEDPFALAPGAADAVWRFDA